MQFGRLRQQVCPDIFKNMSQERVFLGWDQPLLPLVVSHLAGCVADGVLDLSDALIVVPTRQAGRRLREALAAYMAELGGAALSVCTRCPPDVGRSPVPRTSPWAVLSIWAEALREVSIEDFPALFPRQQVRDFAWAVKTGRTLQQLRLSVAEAGLSLNDVASRADPDFEEIERWQDLARIESHYLDRMRGLGLNDPVTVQLQDLRNPHVEEGVRRIVVAGVSDPGAGLTQVLSGLAAKLPVEILIHAPSSLADAFDAWGRPRPDYWLGAPTPVSLEMMFLEAGPHEQALRVADILARHEAGIADFAIGVPDSDVVAALSEVLEEADIEVYSPASLPLADHPAAVLVRRLAEFAIGATYTQCAALLRHPDVLSALARMGTPAAPLLSQLDDVSADHLPTGFDQLELFASAQGCTELSTALAWLDEKRHQMLAGLLTALPDVLKDIYSGKCLGLAEHHGRAWQAGAEVLAELIAEAGPLAGIGPETSPRDTWTILSELIDDRSYSPPSPAADLELEGWLELPWNPATHLVITGMNEGVVPDGRVDDPFLPDRLRSRLGLRTDATRCARDAHAIATLAHSRAGKLWLISGKRSADGDPLKPSRLLLRCPDRDLLDRVHKLMGDAPEQSPRAQPQPGFMINLPRAADLDEWAAHTGFRRVSPSLLRDYLSCPFRFFLKRVLGMQEAGEGEGEMDALGFGNMVHAALEDYGSSNELRECDSPELIASHLHKALEAEFRRQYGDNPPFSAVLQYESARERLSMAATEQARLIADGWRIHGPEQSLRDFELMPGVLLQCRIDRIDRNIQSGEWRVLDYKTSDSGKAPAATHMGTFREEFRDYRRVPMSGGQKRRSRAWVDLQLPLYALALSGHLDSGGLVGCGYFNLPRSEAGAGVQLMELTDELAQSALSCARGIVTDLQAMRFWPPSRVHYDDFERLFPLGIEQAVAAGCFDEAGRLL